MPDPTRTFLVSSRYQVTSELAFYVPGRPPAYNFNLGRRLNQYDFWEGPDSRLGWDAVYVEEGANRIDHACPRRVHARRSADRAGDHPRGAGDPRVQSLPRYRFLGPPAPAGQTRY